MELMIIVLTTLVVALRYAFLKRKGPSLFTQRRGYGSLNGH